MDDEVMMWMWVDNGRVVRVRCHVERVSDVVVGCGKKGGMIDYQDSGNKSAGCKILIRGLALFVTLETGNLQFELREKGLAASRRSRRKTWYPLRRFGAW